MTGLITNPYPFTDFANAQHHHGSDEIKVIIEWTTEE